MQEKTKLTLGGIIVITTIIITVYKMRDEENNNINFTYPQKRDLINQKIIYGTIETKNNIIIRPKISGILEKIYTKVGKKVKKNSPIARIAPLNTPNKIQEANAKLKVCKLKENHKNNDYKRNKALFASNVISKKELEKSESLWKEAKENLVSARKKLNILKKGYIPGDKEASNMVYSTIEGTILELPFEEGNYVIERSNMNEGSKVAVIANMNQLVFRGYLYEREVAQLKEGTEFEIKPNALDNISFKAKLIKISPISKTIDGVSKFEVEAEFDDSKIKKYTLRSGYTAIGEVIIQESKKTLSIEEKYLLFKNKKPYVIVSKNRKKIKEVTLGISDGTYIEIKDGLKATDKVYLDPNKKDI